MPSESPASMCWTWQRIRTSWVRPSWAGCRATWTDTDWSYAGSWWRTSLCRQRWRRRWTSARAWGWWAISGRSPSTRRRKPWATPRRTPAPGAWRQGGLAAGLGMAMGNQMAQGVNPPAAPAAGPPPLPGAAHYYAGIGGKQAGPFADAALAEETRAGRITRETLVWTEGMADWKPAGEVEPVAKHFGVAPPPTPAFRLPDHRRRRGSSPAEAAGPRSSSPPGPRRSSAPTAARVRRSNAPTGTSPRRTSGRCWPASSRKRRPKRSHP